MAKKKESLPAENYRSFVSGLKASGPGRLYVFYGEEDYLRTEALGMLKKRLVDETFSDFNYSLLEGEKLEISALTEAVNSVPFFSSGKLVVVRDYDMFHAAESARDALAALLTDLPDYICLVFLYERTEYRPDGRMKKLSEAMKSARLVHFEKQTEAALSEWIIRRFAREEKKIERSDAAYLAGLKEYSMSALVPEIQKLTAYAHDETVTRSEIDTVVEPPLETVVFRLTDKLSEGNFSAALSILSELYLTQNEPIPILAAMGKQLREMYCAKVLNENGGRGDALQKIFGLSDYVAGKLRSSAGKFSMEWCAAALVLCTETDRRLKSGTDQKAELELLLFRLAEKAAVL